MKSLQNYTKDKKMVKINKIVLTISLSLICSMLNASDNSNDENNAFDDFMNILEETTQIATKNKVNADFAPGIVSILKGEDLKRLGAKDFYDALKFIPNVEINRDNEGSNQIVIRGIGGILGSGKTQILINGVSQNTASMAIFYANLPIEVIDRIEVLRGPGSVLYGGFALNGTINIITKKDTNSVFSSFTKLNKNNIKINGATFFQQNKDLTIDGVVSIINTKGLQPYTQDSYGNAHDAETNRYNKSFISNIKYKDFLAKIALYQTSTGEFFGAAHTLPENDSKDNYKNKNKNIELSYAFNLSNDLKIVPKIGYYKYSSDFEMTKFDPGIIEYNHPYNQYEKINLANEIYYKNKNHSYLVGIEQSTIKEKDNSIAITTNPPGVAPAITTTSTKTDAQKNKRTLKSLYAQDNISLNKELTLNLGVRYEKYDDKFNKSLGNIVLPKIASVYILDDENIFKAQYGKAYRPTTFLENKYNNPQDIDAEIIDTIELQHILKKENTKLSTTLFYSKIKNMIEGNGRTYSNKTNEIISKGVEFELVKNFSNEYLLSSTLSYTDAYDKTTKNQLADYSKILSNVSLSYRPYSIFSTSVNVRYIGEKKRDSSDTRDDMRATTTADIVFKYLPKQISNDLDMVFGIKNITDEIVKSPSSVGGIPDDYISQRRSYFISIEYKF